MDEKFDFVRSFGRFEAICRVLIVFSFLEYSIRLFLTLEGQMETMIHLGYGPIMGCVLLFLSMFLQFSGSIMVALKVFPQIGCMFLLAFDFIHPFVYAQLDNVEFVLEVCPSSTPTRPPRPFLFLQKIIFC